MTSLIPKNPLPVDGPLALLSQTNPLNLAAEAEHSQAVASLHAAAQTVFSAQAAQIAQLQATNLQQQTQLNDLKVTHKAELESQKALLTATTDDLTAQIADLNHKTAELNHRYQELYNFALKVAYPPLSRAHQRQMQPYLDSLNEFAIPKTF